MTSEATLHFLMTPADHCIICKEGEHFWFHPHFFVIRCSREITHMLLKTSREDVMVSIINAKHNGHLSSLLEAYSNDWCPVQQVFTHGK